MNYSFDSILDKALKKCKPLYSKEDKLFDSIYPFTNENIKAYLDFFELENQTLLTVGSSGDQAINAYLKNPQNITIFDICPYTKYYFYLKKSAILSLTYEEFFDFFCYYNYPKTFTKNKNVFNYHLYQKIRVVLKELDKESLEFWDILFKIYSPLKIHEGLISSDENKLFILRKTNPYLENEQQFFNTKRKIIDLNPNFILGDIFELKLNESYDNIFLSNIGQYYQPNELLELLKKLDKNLNINGQILICYLFDTIITSKYDPKWNPIFNLENTLLILKDYITGFESFQGIKGVLFESDTMKDSIITYKKR